VVAVTHAVMIRLAVARLTGIEGEEWRIPVGRGSLTQFHVEEGRISLAELPEGDDVD
jgi:broad specificity phosphatase PhoE